MISRGAAECEALHGAPDDAAREALIGRLRAASPPEPRRVAEDRNFISEEPS